MRRQLHVSFGFSLLTAVLCTSAAAAEEKLPPQSDGVDLVVIVADSVQLTDITLAMLRRIFTQGKLTLPDGTTMIPINAAPRSVERTLFDRAVLKMDPETAGRFWIDQKIRGLALPPK